MKKMYCLVVTDDYSRFSWVFFLATKYETSEILKTFITGIENLIDLKVKVIRCDNGTEFKNKVMNQFYEMKGIEREFSVSRTLQQNGAEAVNIACYVQNRVLVIKPHNKTPYELFLGRKPALSFMRPFRCLVTILNTLDYQGKFDGKADEGFFVGYSTNSKAFRVFNSRTRIVEENMHVKFSEETPNIAGNGPNWIFDIDALTKSMNYKPVVAWNQTNGNAGTKENINACQARKKIVYSQEYILLPLLTSDQSFSKGSKDSPDDGFKPSRGRKRRILKIQRMKIVSAVGLEDNVAHENIVYRCDYDPNMPNLEKIAYSDDDEDVGAEANINNLNTFIHVSPILTTRLYKDYPLEQIIGDIHSAPQTRRMTKSVIEHGPKKAIQALTDPSWIEAMQDKLLQFKLQKVYINNKDDRGIVVRNKARLVAQGCTQEEGIDYDEVFALVARIEAIRLFLAYASFMNFIVYQNGYEECILYGTIEELVYVCQPLAFEDPKSLTKCSLDEIHNRSCQFLGKKVDFMTCKKRSIVANSAMNARDVWNGMEQQLWIDIQVRKAKRTTEISQSSGPIPLVTDKTVIKEWEDRMERAATTASSLEVEQDSGNINKTQSMAILNESLPQGTDLGSGPRCQDTILGV
ncbi:ribonuclease H-like domain-containing protein [Tanacetum coccineum]